MSSILKALKKLEDEKTARKPESLNIDAEILRGDAPPRISLPGICLVAAFVFVCGGSAMYVYMKPGMGTLTGKKVTSSELLPAGRPAPSPAPPTAPRTAQEQLKEVRTEKPSLTTRINSDRTQLDSGHTPPSPGSLAKPQTIQPVKPSETKRSVETPAKQTMVTAGQPATPILMVNGIAFQDGVGDSVAVVNGISVSNGSVIEGVKVEDIQKDLVRFSFGGEKFEVMLGKSNR